MLSGGDVVLVVAKAVLTGFIVAAPLGPIAAICIRRALAGRWGTGVATGLGGASGDVVLVAFTIFGLGLVQDVLLAHETYVRLFGGLFLIGFGVHMVVTRTPARPPPTGEERALRPPLPVMVRDMARGYGTGVLLTVINPAPLIAFIGVFAGVGLFKAVPLGIGSPSALLASAIVMGGVFVGAGLWWMTLVFGSSAARGYMSTRLINRIDHALGLLVVALGVYTLGHALWRLLGD